MFSRKSSSSVGVVGGIVGGIAVVGLLVIGLATRSSGSPRDIAHERFEQGEKLLGSQTDDVQAQVYADMADDLPKYVARARGDRSNWQSAKDWLHNLTR